MVSEYAYHLGLAFQMRDDIFDYSPKMDTGKLAGADLKERKITLPLLCAMETDPQRGEEIRKMISGIGYTISGSDDISDSDKEIIGKVTSFINEMDGISRAQHVLESHISKAMEAIAPLPQTRAKERLLQLAEFVGQRNS